MALKLVTAGVVASGRRRGGVLPPGTHTMTVSSNITDWDVNLPYVESDKARIPPPAGLPTQLEFRGTVIVDVSPLGTYSVTGGTLSLVGFMPITFKDAEFVYWFYDGVVDTVSIPSWTEPSQSIPEWGRQLASGAPSNLGIVFNQGYVSMISEGLSEAVSADLSNPDNTFFSVEGKDLYGHPIAGIPLAGGALQPDGTIVIPLRGVPPGDLNNHPTEGCTDAVATTNALGFVWAFYMSGTITLTKQ